MPRYDDDGGWPAYVPVAERRLKAEREMKKLRKQGHPVAPVVIAGRAITTTFWGKAWSENLESYHDYESRLPRGRTYVRNGSVVDLQIEPREVTARVSGSSLYSVVVRVEAVPKVQWQSICRDCTGGIDSLVELLQGRFSKGVMERLCRQDAGLFPKPSQIRFSCDCMDYASMCKHVAAVLYGIGARLDEAPELLFRLRAVDEKDLLANLDAGMALSKTGPAAGKLLEADDMSALFGLEMADADAPPVPIAPKRVARPKPAAAVAPTPVPLVAKPKRTGKAVQAAPAAPAAVPAKPDVATKARKGTKVSAPTPAPVPTTAPVDPQPEKTIRRVASKRASLLKGRWIRLASNLDGG